MRGAEDITGWADRIEHAIASIEGCCVARVFVYQRVSSTQDAAARHHTDPGGTLVVASEQTRGRGRLGRRWDDGVAATLPMSVAFRTGLDDIGLSARAGLAAWRACKDRLPDADVRIKWPNDVVVGTDRRKLAGVLIERRDGVAIVGTGINVHPIETGDDFRPISFDQLGIDADRCDLAIGVIQRLSEWLTRSDDDVRAAWAAADAMVGTERSFENDRTTVHGEVIALDPLSSIVVRTASGKRTLDVATTRNAV